VFRIVVVELCVTVTCTPFVGIWQAIHNILLTKSFSLIPLLNHCKYTLTLDGVPGDLDVKQSIS